MVGRQAVGRLCRILLDSGSGRLCALPCALALAGKPSHRGVEAHRKGGAWLGIALNALQTGRAEGRKRSRRFVRGRDMHQL